MYRHVGVVAVLVKPAEVASHVDRSGHIVSGWKANLLAFVVRHGGQVTDVFLGVGPRHVGPGHRHLRRGLAVQVADGAVFYAGRHQRTCCRVLVISLIVKRRVVDDGREKMRVVHLDSRRLGL